MKVLLIGAAGTIGREIAAALSPTHKVIPASRTKSAHKVDMADPDSIRKMYEEVGQVDAVISAAGEAKFAPLAALTEEDFQFCLSNKLMGQINLVRLGFDFVSDAGSFILTSGVLAQQPMAGGAAISVVNAGLEGFARAAALESPRKIRVNIVSPPWVKETLAALGMDTSQGTPAATVARAYVQALEGSGTGKVVAVGGVR